MLLKLLDQKLIIEFFFFFSFYFFDKKIQFRENFHDLIFVFTLIIQLGKNIRENLINLSRKSRYSFSSKETQEQENFLFDIKYIVLKLKLRNKFDKL